MTPDSGDASRLIRSPLAPVVLIALGLATLVGGLGFRESAGRFPVAVSVLLIVLAAIDLYCRTGLPGAGRMAAFWGADFTRREMPHDPPLAAELREIGWVVAGFALMAVVGILPALPVYVGGYVLLRGMSPRIAAFVAAGMLVFVVGVFELALDYTLYRGLLFTDGGVAAW